MARALRRSRGTVDVWPGWVDGLSSLVMVVIFVLLLFVVAQVALQSALSGRDAALERLNREVARLGEQLGLVQEEADQLELERGRLVAALSAATVEREDLTRRLADLAAARAAAELQAADASDEAALAQLRAQRAEATQAELESERDRVLADLAAREAALTQLEADLAALRAVRQTLEEEVAALALVRDAAEARSAELGAALEAQTAETDSARERLHLTAAERDLLRRQFMAVRDRSLALETELSDSAERTALAQRALEARDATIAELLAAAEATEAALEAKQGTVDTQAAQLLALNRNIEALRGQLQRLAQALELAETAASGREVEIADLTRRLNEALASKVEDLARYRSEFFGRLRRVLGERQDVRIVGDRFVFQSEVLFDSGQASLGPQGRERLAELAATLLDLAREIPDEVDWVLRVDGHTDPRPISTAEFPSNWELSTARALNVVRFLRDQGVPPDRLAATGFGEFQPIDPGDDEIAWRRNRRIELKLDQR